MKANVWIYALLFSSIALWSACDDDNDSNEPSLNETDKNFAVSATRGNLAEIRFGELAASKGNSQAVRDFGQQMIDEHTPALDELEDIVDEYSNDDLPDEMDDQHKQLHEQLSNMDGNAFDSAYMASQVADHEATVALFQQQVNSGSEARLKSYASKYLPHIEMHLQKADSIYNVVISREDPTDEGTDGSGDGAGDAG